MKKTKKLLSLLTALAITASSFAAMVIPASAEPDDPATPTWQIGRDGSAAATTDTVEKDGVQDALLINDKNVYAAITDVDEGTVEFKTDVYLDPTVQKNFRIVLQNEADEMYNTETAFAQVAFNNGGKVYTGPDLGDTGTELFTYNTAGWYTFDITLDYAQKATDQFITLKVTNATGDVQGEEKKMGAIDSKDTTLKAIRLVRSGAPVYFANYTVTPGSVLAPVATPEPDPTEDPSATKDPSATETPFEGVEYDFEDGADIFTYAGSNAGNFTKSVEDGTGDNTSKVVHIVNNGTQSGGRSMTARFTDTSKNITGGTDVIQIEYDWQSSCGGNNNAVRTTLADASNNEIFGMKAYKDGRIEMLTGGDTTATTVSGATAGTWYKVSVVLDFETHRILKAELLPYAGGAALGTVKNVPFISDAAAGIAGYNMYLDRSSNEDAFLINLDNIKASNVNDDYFKSTITVTDNSDNPVDGATVTIDGTAYTTDAQGKVVTKLPVAGGEDGTYTYTVAKAGYTSTGTQEGTETVTGEISSESPDADVTYTLAPYDPQAAKVTISGGQKVMTAPHTEGKTVTSKAFSATVIDQKGVDQTANEQTQVTWEITPATEGVTVSADGVVSVTTAFDGGETHKKTVTLTPTVTINGKEKTEDAAIGTATIEISSDLFYEPGVDGTSYGETEIHAVGDKNYITTGSGKNSESTITLPDPIAFKAGTAQKLAFDFAMTQQNVYTFQRSIKLISTAEATDTPIITFDFCNYDIGTDATWASGGSSLGTTWGTLSGLNTWMHVEVLFKTYANGETQADLTVGENSYELGKVEGTNLSKITLNVGDCGGGTNRYVAMKDIIATEEDATKIEIGGAKQVSSINGVERKIDYEVLAMMLGEDETFEWTTDIEGATITADAEDTSKAVLTVPGTVTEGGKITVKSSDDRTAEIQVTIAPAVPDFAVEGPAAIELQDEEAEPTYSVSAVKDQYGDDISAYVEPVWSSSNTDAATIDAATGKLTAVGKGTTTIAATITNGTIESKKETTVILDNFYITGEVADGAETTDVDMADIVAADKYLVTTADADGKLVKQEEVDAPAGMAPPTTKTVASEEGVKITATYTGNALTSITAPEAVAVGDEITEAAAGTKVFYWKSLASMEPIKTEEKTEEATGSTSITINTEGATTYEIAPIFSAPAADIKAADERYTFNVPADTYNLTVKMTGQRADIYANEQLLINNMLQSGATPNTDEAHDIYIKEGYAKINTRDYGKAAADSVVSELTLVKAPSNVARIPKVYVLGDSLVAKYYDGDKSHTLLENETEEQRHKRYDVLTGWGQVLDYYLKDTVEVIDLANSGADSPGLNSTAITQVVESAKEGDIMVLESGYNDKGHDWVTEAMMTEAVTAMYNKATAKGVTTILVSPNASRHDYNNNVAWTANMAKIATDLEADYIDLSKLSFNFLNTTCGYSDYSTNETLNHFYNIYSDGMNGLHSTFYYANVCAAIVAGEMSTNDNAAISGIVDTSAVFEFKDPNNATVHLQPNAITFTPAASTLGE